MKCIEEAIEEGNLFDADEDDTFKDVEPPDLDKDDDYESPVVCGDDLCLSRVGMKAYFKHQIFTI